MPLSVLRRGILKAFDGTAYTATLQMDGSLSRYLAGIAVSRGIAAAEMVAERKVSVVLFDEANPGDWVVVGVYT